jgi:hypothetical protein
MPQPNINNIHCTANKLKRTRKGTSTVNNGTVHHPIHKANQPQSHTGRVTRMSTVCVPGSGVRPEPSFRKGSSDMFHFLQSRRMRNRSMGTSNLTLPSHCHALKSVHVIFKTM